MKTIPTHSTRRSFLLTCLLTLSLLQQPLLAAKPGGGGTAPPPPAGTIYYTSGGIYSMKPDGTNKTALGLAPGYPGTHVSASRMLHGGKRWFLRYEPITADGDWAIYATREDGATRVQLTSDPSLSVNLAWTPQESATEAIVAGVGERQNVDGSVDPASMGIYSATLQFDAAGVPIGLVAPPSLLLSVGTVPDPVSGTLVPDVYGGVSWSADLTKVAADRRAGSEIRIIDVASGFMTTVVSAATGTVVRFPAWAPNGQKIAFSTDSSRQSLIQTVLINGTGRLTVASVRSMNYVSRPVWSPDSAYIAYQHHTYDPSPFNQRTEVMRVTASGTGGVNLTQDLAPSAAVFDWR